MTRSMHETNAATAPYQGSKKNIAKQIFALVPDSIDALVKPFAGNDITAQLNEIYAEEDSSLDPGIMALPVASIGDEQW